MNDESGTSNLGLKCGLVMESGFDSERPCSSPGEPLKESNDGIGRMTTDLLCRVVENRVRGQSKAGTGTRK